MMRSVAAALCGLALWLVAGVASAAVPARTEPAAERMLAAQTASGGWPKHLAGRAIAYDRPFDAATRAASDLGYRTTVIADACATRDLEFQGTTVPAAQVHAAMMSGLAFGYATVTDARDWIGNPPAA